MSCSKCSVQYLPIFLRQPRNNLTSRHLRCIPHPLFICVYRGNASVVLAALHVPAGSIHLSVVIDSCEIA